MAGGEILRRCAAIPVGCRRTTASVVRRGGSPVHRRLASSPLEPIRRWRQKMLILQQKTPKWALDASAKLPLAR
ncbi:hypothetical protein EOD23_09215 [Mesorhizobium sp. USDA-HM6]|nr:hypothetical protein EOD23_09215 [Mesorhizobium sp. USDA-HM6]